ncbi:hypothetical protein, partial [Aeromonas caviae]|uniref:hypothetical protein n=1 Tax=Aeromonas caviae TaxID=648 RepID=UPI002B45DD20
NEPQEWKTFFLDCIFSLFHIRAKCPPQGNIETQTRYPLMTFLSQEGGRLVRMAGFSEVHSKSDD